MKKQKYTVTFVEGDNLTIYADTPNQALFLISSLPNPRKKRTFNLTFNSNFYKPLLANRLFIYFYFPNIILFLFPYW